MQLRERQKEFVDSCVAALLEHDNTLGVAPTGAGKTIMLSAVVGELAKRTPNFKACVLAHRKELTEQNTDKFIRVNPEIRTSIVNADIKDWSGQVTFAMVQTLAGKKTLRTIPPLDLLVIDETHHATARSYEKIIGQAKEANPFVKIFGVTATPQRSDKVNLNRVFNHSADQIYLSELIDSGHLVAPETFVVDVAKEKLEALKVQKTGDYRESEVAEILDQPVIMDEIMAHWRRKAGDRKTVIFCSTIEHAKHVSTAFNDCGVSAVLVTSELTKEEREQALRAVSCGEAQVLINVSILTEGWDFPPISCVVLLRQTSCKPTMIQMVGRGLRTIDSNIYPGIEKKDCVVLDFGISTALHGCIEQDIDLERQYQLKEVGEAPMKICKGCDARIPARTKKCSICGYEHEKAVKEAKKTVSMLRIDLLKASEVQWVEFSENSCFSCGFEFWCYLYEQDGNWIVKVGELKDNIPDTDIAYTSESFKKALSRGSSFLKKNEGLYRIKKTVEMRSEPATDKQLKYLPKQYKKVSKGEASMLLAFEFDVKLQLRELGIIASIN